jgi:hypothetical protein
MKSRGRNLFITGIMTAGIMVLAGCSSNQNDIKSEPDMNLESESNISVTTEAEEEKPDNNDVTLADQDEAAAIGELKPEVITYFESTYGDFLKQGGADAEFLHGGRYIADCPDLDAEVVYEGMWHDDTADFSIEDSSMFLRLEGNTSAFFTGNMKEQTVEEFISELEENYSVASEYRESAGTAYYVSGEDYLHIELDSKDDEEVNSVIEIACKEGEKISPDSYCWVMGQSEDSNLFTEMPGKFAFSSGAGGWSTDIEISEDGSFVGQYHDSDMGVTGEGYPNGTLYICNFSGKFSNPEPTDKEYVYSMKLLEMNIENEEKIGTEEIVDETLYVYSTPYGFEDADEFLIYLPGASLSDMTEECRSWIFLSDAIFMKVPDGYFVIYNIGGQEAFTGQNEDSIWYRSCRYENGTAYVNFSPSYYMGSYLNFFTDENSPSALGLSVPWDGKSTETMECKKSWDDDGTIVRVTIEPDEGTTSEFLKYVITVECISDPQFDFSAWGSSEPGRFRAVFTEKKE